MANTIAQKIRAKKLGVLLRDARKAAGKSMQECAAIINISGHRIGSYELGDVSPSLPELEGLAYFLDVPLAHFWGDSSLLMANQERQEKSNLKLTIPLRRRIIGAKLRQARLDKGMTMVDLAAEMGITAGMLGLFERGERSIPLPTLEIAISILNVSLKEYHDQTGVVGQWSQQQQVVEQFLDLSPALQSFIVKPVNTPFLEIAMRLSSMSVDKIRAVAEGLLDITF